MKFALILSLFLTTSAFNQSTRDANSSSTSGPQTRAKLPAGMSQGIVGVWCVIDGHGKVTEAKVKKHLTKEADAAALNAVKSWKFEPAMKDGKPVMIQAFVEVVVKNTQP